MGLARYAAVLLLLIAGHVGAQPLCPGDCDGSGSTALVELDAAVRAVFETPTACAAADLDDSGEVSAAELLRIRVAIVDPPAGCTVEPRSTWMPIDPLPGGPRQEIGVAALDGRVYVLGGLTDTGAGSALAEIYNTASEQWEGAAALPAQRHHIGAVGFGGHVYSVGGFVGQSFEPAREVYRYDPAGNEWSTVAPLPRPRGALAVAELNGLLYASGGSGRSGSVADHAVYDPVANQWTELEPLPSPRNHLAAVALGPYYYVVGGRSDGGGAANTGELDRYDPASGDWTVLAPMPTARSGIAAAVFAGRIVVMGGEVNFDNPPTNVFVEVEMYDPVTDRWSTLEPMAVARHGIGAATVGDLIYVPGGATSAGFAATAYSDVLRIFP
jgi:N-acetylneuraminic acid mutarotase